MGSSDQPLLLDVNALLALSWPNHQFHGVVLSRLEHPSEPVWATCAFTQIGFVRLSSNPAVIGVRKSPAEAVELLTDLVKDRRHVYLPALPDLPSSSRYFQRLLGHQQVTDAYLVAIAAIHSATLLTLDRRLSVLDAKNVEIIEP